MNNLYELNKGFPYKSESPPGTILVSFGAIISKGAKWKGGKFLKLIKKSTQVYLLVFFNVIVDILELQKKKVSGFLRGNFIFKFSKGGMLKKEFRKP